MGGSSYRIAHVVQAIEDSHEIVVPAWKFLCLRHFEDHAVGYAGASGRLAGRFNRLGMVVESEELRIGECFCHQYGGSPFSAADIAHSSPSLKFLFDRVQGRNPRAHKVGGIAGTKELLTPVEDAVYMFMPTHASAGAKGFRDAWDCRKRAQSQFKGSGQIGGTVFRCQGEGLFFTQAEPTGLFIVGDVAPCSL